VNLQTLYLVSIYIHNLWSRPRFRV